MSANSVTPTLSTEGSLVRATWSMIADSTGLSVSYPYHDLESVHAFGTWDTSGKVAWQASIDAANYSSMLDKAGTPAVMDFTADGFKLPSGQAYQFRPKTTANGATSAVAVTIVAFFRRKA